MRSYHLAVCKRLLLRRWRQLPYFWKRGWRIAETGQKYIGKSWKLRDIRQKFIEHYLKKIGKGRKFRDTCQKFIEHDLKNIRKGRKLRDTCQKFTENDLKAIGRGRQSMEKGREEIQEMSWRQGCSAFETNYLPLEVSGDHGCVGGPADDHLTILGEEQAKPEAGWTSHNNSGRGKPQQLEPTNLTCASKLGRNIL